MGFPSPVKNHHADTYDAINPSQLALSSKGKNVLITGAGSGIGRGIALSFAKSSADNIAILGRRLAQLEETKQLIEKSYPKVKVHAYSADVTDLSALESAFSSYASAINGTIHVLVANAGMHPGSGTVMEFPTESLEGSLRANILGTANTLKAWTPYLPSDKNAAGYKANLIHVSSGVAHTNFPNISAYSVGKVGAAKLVEFYALENPDIFALNLHPGVIETPMSTGGGLPADGTSKSPINPALIVRMSLTILLSRAPRRFYSMGCVPGVCVLGKWSVYLGTLGC